MPRPARRLLPALLMFAALATPLRAQDPPELGDVWTRLRTAAFDPSGKTGAALGETLAGLSPEQLAPTDLVRLVSWDPVGGDADYMAAARPRLEKLATGSGLAAPGAASVLLLQELRTAQSALVAAAQSGDQARVDRLVEDMPDQAARTRAILDMPQFDAAVRDDLMATFFRGLSRFNMRGARDELLPLAMPLQRFLTEEVSFQTLVEMFGLVHMALEGAHAGLVEPSQARALSARYRQILEAVRRDRDLIPGEQAWCEQASAMLGSAWGEGRSLAGTLPELRFAWSSDPSLGDSLEDLRGEVVVLDFWATWCTGCVAAFPQLRAFSERFADEPVRLLSVTSHQGQVPTADGWVSTAGDRAVEERHMRTFMDEHGLDWPVVFSETTVFDPGFEVHVLPHLAVLGKDGQLLANDVRLEELAATVERALADD